MRAINLFILLFICYSFNFGQCEPIDMYDINFDNSYGLNHLTIDTISNPNNIWYIGVPQKGENISAYSSPNVIMTDTSKSYPINDTSSFVIANNADYGFVGYHTVILAGKYLIDSDSLTDYGMIEFSPDNGYTWIDMLNDTILGKEWYWDWFWPNQDKPILTGNSNGWQYFWVHLAALGNTYNIELCDTVLYKFTFISDNKNSNKAGLMFDDLHFEDWFESGIKDNNFSLIKSTVFPNPTKNHLTIEFDNLNNSEFDLYILDLAGKIIYKNHYSLSNQITLNISNLESGLFYYRLVNHKHKQTINGCFIKE